MSRLRVDEARSDELVHAFKQRLRLVDGFDGFVDLEVWRSDRDAGEVLMISRWRDRAAFTAYMRSAEHRRSHERIPADLDDAIRLERFEHLHTYEVVAEGPSGRAAGRRQRWRAGRAGVRLRPPRPPRRSAADTPRSSPTRRPATA